MTTQTEQMDQLQTVFDTDYTALPSLDTAMILFKQDGLEALGHEVKEPQLFHLICIATGRDLSRHLYPTVLESAVEYYEVLAGGDIHKYGRAESERDIVLDHLRDEYHANLRSWVGV